MATNLYVCVACQCQPGSGQLEVGKHEPFALLVHRLLGLVEVGRHLRRGSAGEQHGFGPESGHEAEAGPCACPEEAGEAVVDQLESGLWFTAAGASPAEVDLTRAAEEVELAARIVL